MSQVPDWRARAGQLRDMKARIGVPTHPVLADLVNLLALTADDLEVFAVAYTDELHRLRQENAQLKQIAEEALANGTKAILALCEQTLECRETRNLTKCSSSQSTTTHRLVN